MEKAFANLLSGLGALPARLFGTGVLTDSSLRKGII